MAMVPKLNDWQVERFGLSHPVLRHARVAKPEANVRDYTCMVLNK